MGLYPRCLGLIGGAGGSVTPGTVRYSLWLGQRLGVSGEDHAPVPLMITSPRGDGAWSHSRMWPHVATGMRTKEKKKEGMERGREGGGAVDARRGHRPCPPAGPQIHGPIAEVTLNQSAFPSLMLSINSPFVLEASLLYKPKTVKKW